MGGVTEGRTIDDGSELLLIVLVGRPFSSTHLHVSSFVLQYSSVWVVVTTWDLPQLLKTESKFLLSHGSHSCKLVLIVVSIISSFPKLLLIVKFCFVAVLSLISLSKMFSDGVRLLSFRNHKVNGCVIFVLPS